MRANSRWVSSTVAEGCRTGGGLGSGIASGRQIRSVPAAAAAQVSLPAR